MKTLRQGFFFLISVFLLCPLRAATASKDLTVSGYLRVPYVGSAPSSPANGQVWATSSGLYVRINGSTVGPLGTGGGGGGGLASTDIDTSAELRAILTDETGTGALVFANSPTLITPALGTPSALVLTNATGLPIGSGLTGAGTGVITALQVAIGSAGAVVVNGGALGTPSSGNGSNLTALNADNIASGTLGAARLPAFTGDITTSAGSASTTLANSGVTAGTYGNTTTSVAITVDAKGRVTGISNQSISSGGSGNVTGASLTSGNIIMGNGSTSITTTNATYSSSNNGTITLGNVSIAGNGTVTLNTVNTTTLNATTFSFTNLAGASGNGTLLIGNATSGNFVQAAPTGTSGNIVVTTGAGSLNFNLANTTVSAGTYGTATQTVSVTFDAAGRATGASNVTITPAVGSITGLGTGVAAALANTVDTSGGLASYTALGAATGALVSNASYNAGVWGSVTDVAPSKAAISAALAQGNITGLTTSSSPQFTAINLGDASDTTLTRTAAGQIAVEGDVVPTRTSTDTLTNKRLAARITTITSSATPTINTDNCDAVTITALAAAITSMTTNLSGTPSNFDQLLIRIKDDGTARAITWGSSFEACGAALPTTTVVSKRLYVLFIYDSVAGKWGCVSTAQES